MFNGCRLFNRDISGWDVSNVINFNYMFWTASEFNQPIGNWDTGSAVSMTTMFAEASLFNQDLSGWDVSSVMDYGGFDHNATSYVLPRPNWRPDAQGW